MGCLYRGIEVDHDTDRIRYRFDLKSEPIDGTTHDKITKLHGITG